MDIYQSLTAGWFTEIFVVKGSEAPENESRLETVIDR